jgi:hypothetical protein
MAKKPNISEIISNTLRGVKQPEEIVENVTEITDEVVETEDEVLEDETTEVTDEVIETVDEEVEEISEVSRDKLEKYIDKAEKKVSSSFKNAKRAKTDATWMKNLKSAGKHDRGKVLAVKKIWGGANVRATEDGKAIKEETIAASSLHPAAVAISDPKAISDSKVKMMASVMGAMSSSSKADLTDWFEKTMAQFGKWGDGAPSASGKNTDSLDMHASNAVSVKGSKSKDSMPKLDSKGDPLESGRGCIKFSVKEDIDGLFSSEDLTEEFKDKASTLFEAALTARVLVEQEALEEAYEEALEEEVSDIVEELTSKIDSYMDYVVENWVKDNRVAIESSLRNQIAEEFIDGLKTLFNEHYIDVPEDKIDIINDLTNMNTILEHKLNDMILENTKLQKSSVEDEMESIFEEVSTGLVETQKEKLAALSEGIEFDNLEVYARKLQTIKEHYFARKSSASNIDNETFELNEEKAPSSYPDVNRYVDAITRTVKHQ